MARFLILIFSLITLSSVGQRNVENIDQLNEDLFFFKNAFYSSHPAVFNYTSQKTLDSLFVEFSFKETEKATTLNLEKRIQIILNEIGCIHSSLTNTIVSYSDLVFPFEVYVLGDSLWIEIALSEEMNEYIGCTILSINGNSVKDIINQTKNHHSSDGNNQTFKYKLLNSSFNKLYQYYFDNEEAKIIEIINADQDVITVSCELIPIPAREGKLKKGQSYGKNNTLAIDTINDIAVLSIASFNGHPIVSQINYKQIFKKITQSNASRLVIDLRNNLGGDATAANSFLAYLLKEQHVITTRKIRGDILKYATGFSKSLYVMDYFYGTMIQFGDKTTSDYHLSETKIKPQRKNHFDGEIFVLTNGYTVSAGGVVSSLLQNKVNAIIIGSETGGGSKSLNGFFRPVIRLPNSKLKILVPQYNVHLNLGKDYGTGVIPNHQITYTVQDKISDVDLEMNKVISLINQQQ